MKTLMSDVLASLKDAPSTAARRKLIAELERERDEPPVMRMDVGHLSADQQDELLRNLERYSRAPERAQLVDSAVFQPDAIDIFGDIIEFHEKFGITYDGPPRLLPDTGPESSDDLKGKEEMLYSKHGTSMAEFRRKFLKEEAKEYATATYRGNHSLHLTADVEEKAKEIREHLADALDALVDTLYVALGNAYLHGFTRDIMREAWNRVHAKNMAKVRVERAQDSKRGSIFDVVKPPGWVAADLTDLVANHIHQPMAHDDVLYAPELGDIAQPKDGMLECDGAEARDYEGVPDEDGALGDIED